MRATVRNTDLHVRDAGFLTALTCTTGQGNLRLAAHIIANFNVAPTDALYPARPHRLEYRLFGSPPSGVVLRRSTSLAAVVNFVLRVHTTNEQLSVSLNHLGDAQAFDDVRSDSVDFHTGSISADTLLRAALAITALQVFHNKHARKQTFSD